jgi:Trk-type K+ transport system membrane component
VGILSLNSTAVTLFIALIVIGGCSFSMAGGIKVSRIVTFLESIKSSILIAFVKGSEGELYDDERDTPTRNKLSYMSILLFILISYFRIAVFNHGYLSVNL